MTCCKGCVVFFVSKRLSRGRPNETLKQVTKKALRPSSLQFCSMQVAIHKNLSYVSSSRRKYVHTRQDSLLCCLSLTQTEQITTRKTARYQKRGTRACVSFGVQRRYLFQIKKQFSEKLKSSQAVQFQASFLHKCIFKRIV